MKTYKGVEVEFHAFLTLALDGGAYSASLSGRFSPENRPRFQLDKRMGGLHSRSERDVEETTGNRNLTIQPVDTHH